MSRISAAIQSGLLETVIDADGLVGPDRLSQILHLTKGELAAASGLARDPVPKTARVRSPATQARLREVTEIINRILPWCGSVQQAFALYRSQPIPAFGDQTAEDLVRVGRARHVMSYLSGIALGGYA